MVIGAISMLIFWGAIIGLIVWGVRQFTHERNTIPVETPLEIAKRRLARGEINRDQFEELEKSLQ
jgi:putative membrane protein